MKSLENLRALAMGSRLMPKIPFVLGGVTALKTSILLEALAR